MRSAPGIVTPPAPARWMAANLMIAAALATAVFALSFSRLEASRTTPLANNCILGADAATFVSALAAGEYRGLKLRKHPLAVVAVATIASPLTVLGLSRGVAGSAALALIQAAGAWLLFTFFSRRAGHAVTAFTLAALALSAFGTVTIFSIVETYGVTFAAVALALVIFDRAADAASQHPMVAALSAGGVGSVIGWANPPALAFLLVYAGLSWSKIQGTMARRITVVLILPAAIALAGTILPTFAFDPAGGLAWQGDYLERYASWSNFADVRILQDYLVSFLIYAFVVPLDHVRCRFTTGDLASMAADPTRLAAVLAMAGALVLGVTRGLAGAERGLVLSALGTTAALFVFYLFFNPDEALLYSSQWTLALSVAAAPGLAGVAGTVAGAAAVALCLSVNLAPLHHPLTGDPRACCPSPPATMLERERPTWRVECQSKVPDG